LRGVLDARQVELRPADEVDAAGQLLLQLAQGVSDNADVLDGGRAPAPADGDALKVLGLGLVDVAVCVNDGRHLPDVPVVVRRELAYVRRVDDDDLRQANDVGDLAEEF
jgi:hypothetical protein